MKKFFIFLGIAMLAFLVLAMVSQSTPEAKERAALRESIKICRQDAKQTNSSIVGGACELLEEKYRKKYGVSP